MSINEIAAWIAPAATMIAACMTASNLGSRVTGWGFVIFAMGSIFWSVVGFTSNQQNIVVTNCFLTLVNFVGVWRWLGRQAKFEQGSKKASDASGWQNAPTLFSAAGLIGKSVVTSSGELLGTVVDVMMQCQDKTICYVVITDGENGGLTEHLRAIAPDLLEFGAKEVTFVRDTSNFRAHRKFEKDNWPVTNSL